MPFQRWLVGYFALVIIATPLIWSGGCLRRLFQRRASKRAGRNGKAFSATRVTHFLLAVISVLNLLLIGGMIRFLLNVDSFSLIWGLPQELNALLLAPPISAMLAAAALVLYIRSLKEGGRSRAVQVYYLLGTMTAIAFVGFTYRRNLLGFRM